MLETLAQVEILHDRQVSVAPAGPKGRCAHEDPLIAVIVPRKPIPVAIDPADRAERPRSLDESVLERAGDDAPIGQRPVDQRERVRWRKRVCVEKEKHIGGRLGRTSVHEGGAGRALRPDETRSAANDALGLIPIRRRRHDDLGCVNPQQGLQVIEGVREGRGIVPGRDDDRDVRIHQRLIRRAGAATPTSRT